MIQKFIIRLSLLVFLLSFALSYSQAKAATPFGFSQINKAQLFDDLIRQVERIDGDVLQARQNRPEPWKVTVNRLKSEFLQAPDDLSAFHVLLKLDATYPGLHTSLAVPHKFNLAKTLSQKKRLPFTLVPRENQGSTKFFVGKVISKFSASLKAGDQILKIENQDIGQIQNEAFLFCSYALKSQCDQEMLTILHSGFLQLHFKDKTSATIKILRKDKQHLVKVALVSLKDWEPLKTPSTIQSDICTQETQRYPDAKLIFTSPQICLYQSKNPETGILRVSTFRNHMVNDSDFVKFSDSARALAPKLESQNHKWKKLIVDVAGNQGGDVPIELTKLLVHQPFQDQWVRLKDIPEYQDPYYWSDLYNSEILYDFLKSQPSPKGGYLPPIPQFPASSNLSAPQMYTPSKKAFPGQIILITNKNCISSCSGFVWSLRQYNPKNLKTVGLPDSGDTTYGRLKIAVYPDPTKPTGYKIHILPQSAKTYPGVYTLFTWTVSGTLTTDEKGEVLSMKPGFVDEGIEVRAGEEEWVRVAIERLSTAF